MYTAREIWDLALSESQLGNSYNNDYQYSISVMNRCYTKLYNRIIEWGEENFIKTMEIQAHDIDFEVQLPCDFYKLHFIGYKSTGTSKRSLPIKKINKGSTTCGYYMRNKHITFSAVASRPIVIEYYVPPVTITFPRKGIKLETLGLIGENIAFDAHNNYLYDGYKYADISTSPITIDEFPCTGQLYSGQGIIVEKTLNKIRLIKRAEVIQEYDIISEEVLPLFDEHYLCKIRTAIAVFGIDHNYEMHEIPEYEFGHFIDGYYVRSIGNHLYCRAENTDEVDWILDERQESFVIKRPYTWINYNNGRCQYVLTQELLRTRFNEHAIVEPEFHTGQTSYLSVIEGNTNDKTGWGIIYKQYGDTILSGWNCDTNFDFTKNIYFEALKTEIEVVLLAKAKQLEDNADKIQLNSDNWSELERNIRADAYRSESIKDWEFEGQGIDIGW
jgi:hypothetical protein